MGSTTCSTSTAITALVTSIEPPGARPFKPGPRSPALPLAHRRSCDRPSGALSRPEPIKLTVPVPGGVRQGSRDPVRDEQSLAQHRDQGAGQSGSLAQAVSVSASSECVLDHKPESPDRGEGRWPSGN